MFSDKVFQITLLVSLAAHSVILLQQPNFNPLTINNKEQDLEVKYVKMPQDKEKKEVTKMIAEKHEQLLRLSSRLTVNKTSPPPFVEINKENVFKADKDIRMTKPSFNKPVFMKTDIIAIKKKIALPPVDIDKINNPSYMNYYHMVRERIRRAAYKNYNRMETGEVFASFIIANNGNLKEVKLIEEKSSSVIYLKEIALRSVRDASPFNQFPKDLDYPQLSFNVVISFEIE